MTTTAAPRTQVLFFDGVDDLDPIGPLEVLTAAGFPVNAVRPAGVPEMITTAHGLHIAVASELSADAQLILVPGGGWFDEGPGVRGLADTALPARLAALHADGAVMAGVCTGVMLLAVAGLLTGRHAVTNRHALADLERFGAHVHRDARVVDDGDLITCGGPSAGLDLAVHLVARFLGEQAACQAAERLEYEDALRPASVPGSPA